MRKENIEQRLRHEFSDIAPNRLDELLAAVDELHEDDTVIDFTQEVKKRRSPLKAVLSAAAALLLIVGAAGLYTNLSADRYIVAVDVNPSVELSVNGLDRISAVTLKNDDAKALIDEASLKGKRVSDAVDTLTEKLCGDGYLTKNCNGVLVSVRSTKSTSDEALRPKIVDSVQKATQRAGFNYAVLYQQLDKGTDGKAELIAKLDGRLENFNTEELNKLSVQELIFLAESLNYMPDNTKLYGKLNGYCSASEAKRNAGLERTSAKPNLVRFDKQLAYEIVYSEDGVTHRCIVSASTGKVLSHEKLAKNTSNGNSSAKNNYKDRSNDDDILSPSQILSILKKSFGLVDSALEDVNISRSTRNGEPIYIVTYKVFGVSRTTVFDARTARMLGDIG